MLLLAFQVRKNGKRWKRITVVCGFPVSEMFTQKQTEVKSLLMEAPLHLDMPNCSGRLDSMYLL
jgi:hypothetical protein